MVGTCLSSTALLGFCVAVVSVRTTRSSTVQSTTAASAGALQWDAANKDDSHSSDHLEYKVHAQLELIRHPEYNIEEVLEELSDLPRNMTLTWYRNVPELVVKDANDQPLPDTDNQTYWQYDIRSSDRETFIHLEHALVRRKGSPDEYLDIHGELWWTPKNLHGRMRHATYRRDNMGFVAKVLNEDCEIYEMTFLLCTNPWILEPRIITASSPVVSKLISSLLG